MALTNQPYIPLYVKDWMTNGKLKMCSTSAHGLMINVMCIMHKEDEYGTLLLKQNFKQSSDVCLDFASYLARLLPFDRSEIFIALQELLKEGVLVLEGEKLISERMVKDHQLSLTRAKSGSKGGKKTQDRVTHFASDFAQAKSQANTANENEIANEIENA
jgi:hypothetical protein